MHQRDLIKNKKPHSDAAWNAAIIGMMAAVLEVGKLALFYLPNIEVVSLFVIIFACVFRKKVFYAIYIFVILEYCFWGFGLWSFSYLYVWTILALIALCFKEEQPPILVAVVSGMYGLLFGVLCLAPDFIVGGWSLAASRFISGIPFDFLHGIGNFVVLLLLYRPMYRLAKKLNRRHYSETTAE